MTALWIVERIEWHELIFLFVSGKCSVSWSSHLLVGAVALLMLCFGLSFCAARHKPSHPHSDPLRIWQSRYSTPTPIHAYASPKTTTLSFVTVCWSWILSTDDILTVEVVMLFLNRPNNTSKSLPASYFFNFMFHFGFERIILKIYSTLSKNM